MQFSWWDLHERAWRRARALFVCAGLVVAVYAAGILAVLGVSVAAVAAGSLDDVGRWIADLDPLVIVLVALALFAAVAVATLLIGWLGLPRSTLRRSGARAPEPDEAREVGRAVGSFAVASGMPAPSVWIVDDPAPNALAFGRPASGHVCVTAGALRLPKPELEALCDFEVTAIASRAHAYATAVVDLVTIGEWCTRLLWSLAALVPLSVFVGVPLEAGAALFVGIVVTVVVTRPLLIAADRGLVGLIDETSELVDLEVMRRSEQPASLANLLLDLVEDPRRARSRGDIAHLWFMRDVLASDELHAFSPELPMLGARPPGVRRDLLERAAAAIDQAGRDPELSERLHRAEAAS